MLETFHWFPGQGFGLIVEDVVPASGCRGDRRASGDPLQALAAYPDGLKSRARQGGRAAHPTFQLVVATISAVGTFV